VERTDVQTFFGSPPQYVQFVEEFGNTNTALIGTAGWARDGRDSAIYTTSGTLQRLNFEVAMPPAELRYYRATYRIDHWIPMGREYTLQLSGQIGYAHGYDQLPLPFYKNYYLGGIGSVRGYYTSSIGPKDALGNALGGPTMTTASAEFYFPFPGLQKDKSVRLSVFVDSGQVSDNFDFSQTRFATGLALSWYSPVGPIKVSFARALNPQPEDRTQAFQFSLGTTF
jgi:outer membrane protein insertion porin family